MSQCTTYEHACFNISLKEASEQVRCLFRDSWWRLNLFGRLDCIKHGSPA